MIGINKLTDKTGTTTFPANTGILKLKGDKHEKLEKLLSNKTIFAVVSDNELEYINSEDISCVIVKSML